mgnify:CR=1 FL=1
MSNDNKPALDDINLDLPEISLENTKELATSFYGNIQNILYDINYWIPLLIIFFALVLGSLVRTFIRPTLMSVIDRLNISYRINRMLKNSTKLLFPLVALIILGLSQIITPSFFPDVKIIILAAASKLLFAWIIIRLLAQIIQNNFIRQSVAMFCWIVAALSILGVMPETTMALNAVGMDFGEYRFSLLTLVKIIVAFFILWTLTRILASSAERSLQRATDLTPSARVLLIKIIKVSLVGLAILIGVTMSGIDLSALAIFGGALGLGIGFGLQKVISNLFSGMLLLIDKSIKPGDVIEMRDNNGAFGWVNQLGARYVSIITRDNKEYLIPNEDFITQPVINWSFTDKKIRVETKFGVDYASDPHQVRQIAIEVAAKAKRVVEEPKPVCHLVEFGDSSLNFVLRYWIEDAENGVTNTKGEIMLGLWDAFKAAGIEIPFPHRVLIEKTPSPAKVSKSKTPRPKQPKA